jgi:hypothetical protein
MTQDPADPSGVAARDWPLRAVHIAAVLALRIARDEDLIDSMVSGKKLLPPAAASPAEATVSTARALVPLTLCAFAVWWTVNRLGGSIRDRLVLR